MIWEDFFQEMSIENGALIEDDRFLKSTFPAGWKIVNTDDCGLWKFLPKPFDKIASDKNVVLHCRSGVRSAKAIAALEKKYGFKNLYNLKGGILAWANEIDPTMAKY